MKSITPAVKEALRKLKADRGIQGVSAWASTADTNVYPYDSRKPFIYRDYFIVGGKRWADREATVRLHEDGTFQVLSGGRMNGRDRAIIATAANLPIAVGIALDHVQDR